MLARLHGLTAKRFSKFSFVFYRPKFQINWDEIENVAAKSDYVLSVQNQSEKLEKDLLIPLQVKRNLVSELGRKPIACGNIEQAGD